MYWEQRKFLIVMKLHKWHIDQNKDPHKHTQQSFESLVTIHSTEKSRLKAKRHNEIQSYGVDYFNPTADNHKLYELYKKWRCRNLTGVWWFVDYKTSSDLHLFCLNWSLQLIICHICIKKSWQKTFKKQDWLSFH